MIMTHNHDFYGFHEHRNTFAVLHMPISNTSQKPFEKYGVYRATRILFRLTFKKFKQLYDLNLRLYFSLTSAKTQDS